MTAHACHPPPPLESSHLPLLLLHQGNQHMLMTIAPEIKYDDRFEAVPASVPACELLLQSGWCSQRWVAEKAAFS